MKRGFFFFNACLNNFPLAQKLFSSVFLLTKLAKMCRGSKNALNNTMGEQAILSKMV